MCSFVPPSFHFIVGCRLNHIIHMIHQMGERCPLAIYTGSRYKRRASCRAPCQMECNSFAKSGGQAAEWSTVTTSQVSAFVRECDLSVANIVLPISSAHGHWRLLLAVSRVKHQPSRLVYHEMGCFSFELWVAFIVRCGHCASFEGFDGRCLSS